MSASPSRYSAVTRCHVCEREVEPAFGEYLPAVTEPDVWTVVMRNGISVNACIDCWGKWPDAHKVFPAIGFGRSPSDELAGITDERLVALLGPA